jgi:hypothetical protein
MRGEYAQPKGLEWKCQECNQHLVIGKVISEYLDNQFTVQLPKCPGCTIVYISEEVAVGKMAEVEQMTRQVACARGKTTILYGYLEGHNLLQGMQFIREGDRRYLPWHASGKSKELPYGGPVIW